MVIVEVGFGIFKNQFEIQITQLEGTGTVGEIVALFLGGCCQATLSTAHTPWAGLAGPEETQGKRRMVSCNHTQMMAN